MSNIGQTKIPDCAKEHLIIFQLIVLQQSKIYCPNVNLGTIIVIHFDRGKEKRELTTRYKTSAR